ncbi:MAG TPA: hypothetical protein PKK06_04655 [Phycisphaerae bacterium]|nr:hypothetical protein [Phycisphaerae bacterium]HNU45130.1 hypothetical protein [Phycisphaerae bacterium]
MIGPLSGLGGYDTGGLGALQGLESGSGSGATSASAPATAGTGSTAGSIDSIVQAVGQLLQQIGGGLEQDNTLRMLVALLILAALWQQEAQQWVEGLWQNLAGSQSGSVASGSSTAMFFSSTTVSVTQTVAYLGNVTGPTDASGGQVDLTA